MRMLSGLLLLAVSVGMTACKDKDDVDTSTTDTDTDTTDTDTTDTETDTDTDTTDTDTTTTPSMCGVYPSTWDGVQAMISDHCDQCHRDESQQAHIDLRAEIQADVANGGGHYVVPGDSSSSAVWLSLSGQSMLPMPPSPNQPLSSDEICHVQEWIDAGAPIP